MGVCVYPACSESIAARGRKALPLSLSLKHERAAAATAAAQFNDFQAGISMTLAVVVVAAVVVATSLFPSMTLHPHSPARSRDI